MTVQAKWSETMSPTLSWLASSHVARVAVSSRLDRASAIALLQSELADWQKNDRDAFDLAAVCSDRPVLLQNVNRILRDSEQEPLTVSLLAAMAHRASTDGDNLSVLFSPGVRIARQEIVPGDRLNANSRTVVSSAGENVAVTTT